METDPAVSQHIRRAFMAEMRAVQANGTSDVGEAIAHLTDPVRIRPFLVGFLDWSPRPRAFSLGWCHLHVPGLVKDPTLRAEWLRQIEYLRAETSATLRGRNARQRAR